MTLREKLERIWQQPGVRNASERNRWVWGGCLHLSDVLLVNDNPVAMRGPSLAPRKRKPLKWPK